jgi:hypothetical protein
MNVFPTWLPWECSNPSNLKVLLRSIHETYLYFLPYGIPIGMPLITTVHSALKELLQRLEKPTNVMLPTNLRDCQVLYSKLVPGLSNLINPNVEVQAAFMALCLENIQMAVNVETPVNPQKVKRLLNIQDFTIYFQSKVKQFQNIEQVRDTSLTYVPYHYWLENFNITENTHQSVLTQMQEIASKTRLPLKSILSAAEVSSVPNDNDEYSIYIMHII